MIEHIRDTLNQAKTALDHLYNNAQQLQNIVDAAAILTASLRERGRILTCGNGGSMCDAMHFAEELSGRFRNDRPAMAATAISDPSYISCVANDYGYDQIFSRYVGGHGRDGDVLLAISTSETSKSVVLAAVAAQAAGMKVTALTGRPDSELEQHAHVCICTLGGHYADRAQELHIKVIHILIELIERKLHPSNYADPAA
jgi:D-sedoheptulose 7-phosphate isomerase